MKYQFRFESFMDYILHQEGLDDNFIRDDNQPDPALSPVHDVGFAQEPLIVRDPLVSKVPSFSNSPWFNASNLCRLMYHRKSSLR